MRGKETLKELLTLKLQIADQVLNLIPKFGDVDPKKAHHNLISAVQEVTADYLKEKTSQAKSDPGNLKTFQIE